MNASWAPITPPPTQPINPSSTPHVSPVPPLPAVRHDLHLQSLIELLRGGDCGPGPADVDYIFFDFETTGLRSSARAWQLAATDGRTIFNARIYVPRHIWEPEALNLFLKNKNLLSDIEVCPSSDVVARAFQCWVQDRPAKQKILLAFNAPFDLRFLQHLVPKLPAEWRFGDLQDLVRIWRKSKDGKGENTLTKVRHVNITLIIRVIHIIRLYHENIIFPYICRFVRRCS